MDKIKVVGFVTDKNGKREVLNFGYFDQMIQGIEGDRFGQTTTLIFKRTAK